MANCSAPLTGLLPINDLGAGTYLGFQGGLYQNGMNDPPLAHYGAGRRIADELAAVHGSGQKFVMAALGFSGTGFVWDQFVPLFSAHPHTNKDVQLVKLTLAGTNADDIANLANTYWTSHVPNGLAAAGVGASDVRVVWVQLGMPPPASAFPGHAQAMQAFSVTAVQNILSFFPNCRIAYVTSGHYHGYSSAHPGIEPYGTYEQGFAVKWLVDDQINGNPSLAFHGPSAVAPWLSWGGYFWCDGATPRSDGFNMACPADFRPDGSHPSPAGAAKMASMLLDELTSDWTARPWMLNIPTGGGTGTPPPLTQTAG